MQKARTGQPAACACRGFRAPANPREGYNEISAGLSAGLQDSPAGERSWQKKEVGGTTSHTLTLGTSPIWRLGGCCGAASGSSSLRVVSLAVCSWPLVLRGACGCSLQLAFAGLLLVLYTYVYVAFILYVMVLVLCVLYAYAWILTNQRLVMGAYITTTKHSRKDE